MIIILTGGTGLVGQALGKKLAEQGYTLRVLSRSPQKKLNYPCKTFTWNAVRKPPDSAFPHQNEKWGVIHLAGESVSRWPWTPRRKKNIYNSRIEGTKNLVQSIKNQPSPPEFFISASALGIYGHQTNRTLTESSPLSESSSLFLEKTCKDWEQEVLKLRTSARVIRLRFGMILSKQGGVLLPFLLFSKLRIRLFSLKPSFMSWIHIQDVVEIILWILRNPNQKGVYNLTAPHPVALNDFSRQFFELLGRKAFFPLPLFLLKLLSGEMAKNLFVNHSIVSEKLKKESYFFRYPNLKPALEDLTKTPSFFKMR